MSPSLTPKAVIVFIVTHCRRKHSLLGCPFYRPGNRLSTPCVAQVGGVPPLQPLIPLLPRNGGGGLTKQVLCAGRKCCCLCAFCSEAVKEHSAVWCVQSLIKEPSRQ